MSCYRCQFNIHCFLFNTGSTCPLPGLLDNGAIEPLGQLYFCGTTVKFSCNQGYILNGTGRNSSMCIVNGTWTEEFPTCEGEFNWAKILSWTFFVYRTPCGLLPSSSFTTKSHSFLWVKAHKVSPLYCDVLLWWWLWVYEWSGGGNREVWREWWMEWNCTHL